MKATFALSVTDVSSSLVVAKAEGDGGDAEGGERKGRAAAETRGRGLQVCSHAPWHMEGGGEAKRESHCLPLCVDLIMLHLSCANLTNINYLNSKMTVLLFLCCRKGVRRWRTVFLLSPWPTAERSFPQSGSVSQMGPPCSGGSWPDTV